MTKAEMNTMRHTFDTVIAGLKNSDQVARLELCREYFCNPAFRVWLQAETFKINQGEKP